MIYDIVSHPLLSEEAREQTPDVLLAHGDVAEAVLGLISMQKYDPGTTDANVARAAIVHQVNYQIELPEDVWALTGRGRGARNEGYRDRLPPISTMAQKLMDQLTLGSLTGWSISRGPRG